MNDLIKIPEWKELVDKAKNWDYGETHTHKEIEEMTGVAYNSTKYRSMIERAKKELLDNHQKLLKAIPGVGYRVLIPDHMTDEVTTLFRAGIRRVEKGVWVGMQTPLSLLSHEKQDVHKRIMDHYACGLAMMKGKQTEVSEIIRLKLSPGQRLLK